MYENIWRFNSYSPALQHDRLLVKTAFSVTTNHANGKKASLLKHSTSSY